MGFKSRSAKNMFKVIVNLKARFYTERYCRRSYICLAANCKIRPLLPPSEVNSSVEAEEMSQSDKRGWEWQNRAYAKF